MSLVKSEHVFGVSYFLKTKFFNYGVSRGIFLIKILIITTLCCIDKGLELITGVIRIATEVKRKSVQRKNHDKRLEGK